MATDREIAVLSALQAKVRNGQFEFSHHATDQSIIRGISVQDVRGAISECELIEDYPDDKYGPSCLVLGFTESGKPLHIHCSHPSRPLIKIITLYEPDPAKWIDFKARREQHG